MDHNSQSIHSRSKLHESLYGIFTTSLVVLGEAHACRSRVTKLVFMVVCRGECEGGSLETSIPENFGSKVRLSVGFTRRIELLVI